MTKEQGKVIVIVAPSGTGKSTLISRIKKCFPEIRESISFTTRARRPAEIDGEHYHFITESEFKQKIQAEEFLEWAMVHGDYKGTSKDFVKSQIQTGSSILFDLDVQGADAIKNYFGNLAQVIFICPPSFEELEKRLRERKTESEEKIKIRLANAKRELARKEDYDYLVINDEIEKAFLDLKNTVGKIIGTGR